MTLNGLFCADVPLKNYSLTHFVMHSTVKYSLNQSWAVARWWWSSGKPWFLRSGEVGEYQSTRVQKLTKMQKKFWTVLRRLYTTVHKFFSARFTRRLFVSTLLN